MKIFAQLLALAGAATALAPSRTNNLMPNVALQAASDRSYLANGGERVLDRPASGSSSTLDRQVPGGALAGASRRNRPVTTPLPVLQNPRHQNAWDDCVPVSVQGDSLRTWSFPSSRVDSVRVFLATEGRPLNANVELWQGPDNCPQKMGIYIEDGSVRPFNCLMYTPRDSNAVAVYNTSPLEYPFTAGVEVDNDDANGGVGALAKRFGADNRGARVVQGGAVYTEPYDPSVEGVTVLLTTDGRPLNARIELLQGPNNNKQVMEVYTEDGLERPLFVVLDTPGVGTVIRIVNTAPMEFPLYASLDPYLIDESGYGSSFVESRAARMGP